MKPKFADNDQPENADSFQDRLRDVERYDKAQRKLAVEFFDLGVFMRSERATVKMANDPVPFFNWFAGCTSVRHTRDGKQYIEIIPTETLSRIVPAMAQWMQGQLIPQNMLKAWSCWGVFIRYELRGTKYIWQYPEYNRRAVNPVDVQKLVTATAENMQIEF